jgi:hypothetical protein
MKLIAPTGRVIIKIDLESKNSHTFADGTKIRLERQYDNFNMRYVKPVNAEVVNAKDIPEGAEILIHHNSTHDTYRLFNYLPPTKDASTSLKYYSIPEQECFFWRENNGSEWKTLNNFVTALRLYKPYIGTFEGIEPSLVKNKLYITSGEYAGNVVDVVNASDYQVIFQGDDGKEESLIRLRHFEGEENEREEIIAVDHHLTGLVKSGKILVGYDKSSASKLN